MLSCAGNKSFYAEIQYLPRSTRQAAHDGDRLTDGAMPAGSLVQYPVIVPMPSAPMARKAEAARAFDPEIASSPALSYIGVWRRDLPHLGIGHTRGQHREAVAPLPVGPESGCGLQGGNLH